MLESCERQILFQRTYNKPSEEITKNMKGPAGCLSLVGKVYRQSRKYLPALCRGIDVDPERSDHVRNLFQRWPLLIRHQLR